jgi:transposase
MKKVREVLRLYSSMSLSIRQIHGAAGVARSTVQDYVKRFEASGLSPAQAEGFDDDQLKAALFPERCRDVKASKPLPDMAYIHQELQQRKKTKVTLMLLWEEYMEAHPDGYAYTQFRVHYNRYRQKLNPSMRQTHIGGEKLFVDYSGLTVPIYDAKSGETSPAQIFVAVLGASGYTFVHATPSQTQEDFIHSHVLAYHFFGGTPRIVVPDNLKSAIISNNRHGIVVNESYADLARHYAMAVEPARPYRPKDKPKAEQGVQGIQRYILARMRHRKFFDINELNDAIALWLDDYNHKIVKHLERSRTQLFETLDRPHLRPLPSNSYVYRQFKTARVNHDYHITLLKCYYSVPYEYLKEEVEVRYSTQSVEIYHHHRLIAAHPRLRQIGAVSTLDEHMPSAHQAAKEKMNPQRLRSWAENIGEQSTRFVEAALSAVEHSPVAYRHIVAVLSMAKLYGKTELELALGYALSQHTIKTKSVRSILEKRLYLGRSANNTGTPSPSLFDNHANLRGPNEYK